MTDFLKRQMMERLGDTIENVAHIRAEEERALIEATALIAEALGEDIRDDLRAFDPEARAEELTALADAMPDHDDVADWYAEHRLPDPGLAAYVGMGEDGAAEQIERWAGRYREDGKYSDHTDRELAEAHVRRAFDCPSLEWWEQNVATVEKRDILRDATAGYMEAVDAELRRLADVADS